MAGEFPSSAFIGWSVELRQLDAVLERAEQGRQRVVLLAGDAGVGKTGLPVVDALRELADDPEEARRSPRPHSREGKDGDDDLPDQLEAQYVGYGRPGQQRPQRGLDTHHVDPSIPDAARATPATARADRQDAPSERLQADLPDKSPEIRRMSY